MTFKVETHSVNGGVYIDGDYSSVHEAKRAILSAGGFGITSYTQFFIRDGDRRVVRGLRASVKGVRWSDVEAAAEDARLAGVQEHGQHPFTYGMYPNDGGWCMVCHDVRANTIHHGLTPVYQQAGS
jgi:hypothetical protein